MRPGCYDIHERIKDMNAGGVLGSMCFPSFPGFAGRLFAGADDKGLALAVLQAYNDWHIDEWCGAYPGRFIPCALPILWDAELAAAEVRAGRGKGLPLDDVHREPGRARLPELPRGVLGPALDGVLRPRRRVVGAPRQLRPAGGHGAERADRRDDHAAADEHLPGRGRPGVVAGDQGVPRRCASRCRRAAPAGSPTSSTASTAPTTCTTCGPGQDFGDKLPSEVFRERFLTCFIADPVGIRLRDMIGIDNIAWECDYPHSDSSWPNAPEELAAVAADVPDDELNKITYENACAGTTSIRSRIAPVSGRRWRAARRGEGPRRLDPVARQGPIRARPRGINMGEMAERATA